MLRFSEGSDGVEEEFCMPGGRVRNEDRSAVETYKTLLKATTRLERISDAHEARLRRHGHRRLLFLAAMVSSIRHGTPKPPWYNVDLAAPCALPIVPGGWNLLSERHDNQGEFPGRALRILHRRGGA